MRHEDTGLLSRSRNVSALVAALALINVGCTQRVVWPKEPLHVVIDEGPDGGIPIRIDGAKAVVPVDDAHRIDSGCTRRFPFRSFAKGTVSEKSGPFAFAGRDGFVYQLEVIPADAGPQPHLQFYDGESPIPVPTAGTWFGNSLSVKATGPGNLYLRASTCGY
jgi:hypothetical protein